ncbi:hypothetical protein [Paenibacillus yonginensis]|nr:hypothetical protein [Paenibacillus yonginensis]
MNEHWFPWESMNFITTPWKLQLALLGSALVLSMVSWYRLSGSKTKRKPPSNKKGSRGGDSKARIIEQDDPEVNGS